MKRDAALRLSPCLPNKNTHLGLDEQNSSLVYRCSEDIRVSEYSHGYQSFKRRYKLERERIYWTEAVYDALEEQARENIQREIALLS